jgi:hypothetical protein
MSDADMNEQIYDEITNKVVNEINDMSIDSDAASLSTSFTTSLSDISICNDIDDLIERCKYLSDHIHNSYESLKGIQYLIENHQNVIVSHNEWTGDFNEILEKCHNDTLENIKNGCATNFGNELLKMLDEIIFH